MKSLIALAALVTFVTCVSCQTLNPTENHVNIPQYKDAAGSQWSQYAQQPSVQQQATQQHPHHEKYEAHYVGPKQGIIGAPYVGVFPIIFLIGLAAIIIIPLLFFTFSPYGFGAGGFSGAGGYGRKRSIGEDFDLSFFRRNLLDLVVNVSDAIEKFGAGDGKKKKP